MLYQPVARIYIRELYRKALNEGVRDKNLILLVLADRGNSWEALRGLGWEAPQHGLAPTLRRLRVLEAWKSQ